MPCLICGGPTRGDSVICDKCMEQELKKKKMGGSQPSPPKMEDDEIELDLDSIFTEKQERSLPQTPAIEKTPAPPKKSDDEISLDEGIELDLDSIFLDKPESEIKPAPEPEKKQSPQEASGTESSSEEEIRQRIRERLKGLKLDKTEPEKQTPSGEADLESLDNLFSGFEQPEEEKTIDVGVDQESEPELDLNLTEVPSEDAEIKDTFELDLDFGGEEKSGEKESGLPETEDTELEIAPAEEEEPVIPEVIPPVTPESDEDILKKNIQERLKSKLSSEVKDEKTTSDSVDDLLDEVILEEIEEIKSETKTPGPVEPVPPQEVKEVKEPLISDEIKTPKIQIKIEKESPAFPSESGPVKKSEHRLVPDHPAEKDTVIRGTTMRRPPRSRERSGGARVYLMVILILVLLGGGGYVVYEKFLKTDPVRKEMLLLLDQARQKEQSGEIEAALGIYDRIVRNYPDQKEIVEVKGIIVRLQNELEKKKKSEEIRNRVNELLTEANGLFERKRWIGNRGRDAFRVYQEVLQIDPENAEARNRLNEMKLNYQEEGQRALSAGRYEEAKASFQKALTIDPNDSQVAALINTCDVLLSQKIKLEAEKQAELERIAEMQRQLQQRMEEERRAQEEEAKRIAEQKRLEEQRRLEQQRLEEERRKKEAEEDMSNKVLLEAQVDGGKREYIKRVQPTYTGVVTKNSEVTVQVIVGTNGVPESVQVLKSDDSNLAEFVINVVREFRYKPPTYKGKPCKMSVIERFSFKPNR